MTISVELTTPVPASPREVWERAVTIEGINHELGPWLRMTVPRRLEGLTAETAPVGEQLGRSWILLLGIVPVDYDDLSLAEIGPGYRFLERSRLASMKLWQHEREIADSPEGSNVTDRLTFEPRVLTRLVPHALLARIVLALFRHRHRRLRAHFDQG